MRMDAAVRIFCALVFIVSALVQLPAGAAMRAAPDMAAYVLPDGSLPDLCLAGHDDPDGKGGTKAHACQSCCLAAPVLLPTPQAFHAKTAPTFLALSSPAAKLLLARPVLLAGSGPRAPPPFSA
ncbi:hypothetical protein E5S70_03685 [Ensifer adhaerens]|uniref:hypothetical protein n=1 Tax=Ensifer canadensis TaxID=555315 RepID=UPI00138F4164|nr:hypothetical protein [Ensifer canadensis]NOV15197.1 hypothetical protein [Ensifer canadensis]